MNSPISILVIEDSLQDFLILKEYITRIDSFQINIFHAVSMEDARISSVDQNFDLVFLDLFLPDSYGKETFINISANFQDVPIVVLSGMIDKSLALSIVQMGAQDYIVKGEFDETLIEKSITYSIERHKNQKRLEESERRYRLTFENAGVVIAEYDATEHFEFIEKLKNQGKDKSYFDNLTKEQCREISKRLKIDSINPEVLRLFGFTSKKDFELNRKKIITQQSLSIYSSLSKAIWDRNRYHKSINIYRTINNQEITLLSRFTLYDFENGKCKIVRSGTDITALKDKEKQIEAQHLLAENLSQASMELLKKGETTERLDKSFEILAGGLNVDVISLIDFDRLESSLLVNKKHRWVREEFKEEKSHLKFYGLPLKFSPSEEEIQSLSNGQIREYRTSLDSSKRQLLEEYRTKSLLLVPVLQENRVWAYLMFVNKGKEKQWTLEEKLTVQSYSSAIGSFLVKTEAEKDLNELNEQLESRIENRTEQLTDALSELESFSYSVSHDLRAPLRKVAGFSQILDKEFSKDLPERAGHLLNNIKDGATEMTHLIHDLLEFSKLGRQSISLNEIPMNLICSEVVKDAKESNPDLDINVKLPELKNACGDVTLVKHVLNNLIWNAVKFSSKREKIQIEFDFKEQNGFYHYSVKDNGIGIDMKYAEKVFAVFQRLHTKDEYEGTGVGLAIVNRIVKKHGGEVSVNGELNKGCTFSFSLPKNRAAFALNNPTIKDSFKKFNLTA